MECYIDGEKYSLEPDANFLDKETWQAFIEEIEESNNVILIPMIGLIEKGLVNQYLDSRKVDRDTALLELHNMIDKNNQSINYIKSKMK